MDEGEDGHGEDCFLGYTSQETEHAVAVLDGASECGDGLYVCECVNV